MSVERDEFGRARIILSPPENTPGEIEVDGDLTDDGPVVILRLRMDSETQEYLERAEPNREIEFGPFRVALQGVAQVEAGLMLSEQQARDLVEQILWQLRPAAA